MYIVINPTYILYSVSVIDLQLNSRHPESRPSWAPINHNKPDFFVEKGEFDPNIQFA